MSIKDAILGFLSWMPLTGYDLKKLFEDSAVFHWSGNNNQIYKALVELHDEGLVTLEVQQQPDAPPRKIYTITDAGRAALREAVLSDPELPQRRHDFFVQLAWADQLSDDELKDLLGRYEEEVRTELQMIHERRERKKGSPQRTPREAFLWDMLMDNWIGFFENEARWIYKVRAGLEELKESK
jgi:DNA-binding PadR family transcriptional regulator